MLTPTTEQDVAEMVRGANGSLTVRGGGTRSLETGAGEVISTAGMSGVTLYEPGALTIVAQAGTPVSEIEAVLAAENQRLPFEPPRMGPLLGRSGESTIGGVVAANASGPRRVQVGACRDSLIGVRFVDGHGDIIKNGGRVMKNVTGYDLVKLMCGAQGALGVLTEVSFKVVPGVAVETTLSLEVEDAAGAVAAMSAALGSPFEVSGAAWSEGRVLLRLEGFADSVAYRVEELQAILAPFGAVSVSEGAASAEIWKTVRDVTSFVDQPGDIWRISVRPSHAPGVVAALQPQQVMLDWGGGLIWARVPEGQDVRTALAGVSGHATRVKGAAGPLRPVDAPGVAALTAGLRAQFDPRGLFSGALVTELS